MYSFLRNIYRVAFLHIKIKTRTKFNNNQEQFLELQWRLLLGPGFLALRGISVVPRPNHGKGVG